MTPQDDAVQRASVAGHYRIGIGCMALTGLYGRISASDARDVLAKAIDLGFRLFDTAPLYANGQNEALIGNVIGSTDGATVATKFGLAETKDGKLLRDSRPDAIRASVEASLVRLRRERIDLLIQHRPDPAVNDQEVAGAVQDLIDAGKVAAFGLSGTSMDRIKPMSEQCCVTVVQNELSFLSGPEAWSAPQRIGNMGAFFMAYAPIARGLLSINCAKNKRDADDYRSQVEAFNNPDQSVSQSLRICLKDVASTYGVSVTALVLAWVKTRGANVVPIPGPRGAEHLSDLVDAGGLEIDRAHISIIEEIASSQSGG
jgi:aryl-alcohol dehydrogenase-like predicted oxidoreductase